MPESTPELPSAGIRLIRETRHESREEFADLIGVAAATVGNWERGDQPPSEANRKAIVDAIPAGLSLQEVLDAEDRFEDTPETHMDERRLFGSQWLQTLREQPRISDELDGGRGVSVFSTNERMFVERLDLTSVEGAGQRDGDRVTTVYYLEGDERRALRRFIEENQAIVREQLSDAPNRFSHEWDEWLYGLLEEEWRFWIYG
ncbi:DNA-binding transcriptional regulator [Halorubrum sp. SD683]|uniref:helix-turn-helix domain-containing protein n=1 Tax=Halorubrum sp. SD683 TaxID=1855873 RepID=UPI000A2D8558|nr:helix-turn-helix transcriptional regulator [Halorubrum sp. SD683]OTF01851.1 hypothetical protein B9G49_00965 [Halorubrum sp. SD683]